MKIIIFLNILLITFILTIGSVLSACTPANPCCCQEYRGGEYKCFASGVCCLEGVEQYWDPVSCFDFKFWVEPERSMFTVGSETRINLYIKNTGAFADNYNITHNITEGNPSLIIVDMFGVSPVNGVARGEIRVVYPRIILSEAHAWGKVFFNATSQGDQNIYRNATLTILPSSDLPVSLPEFGFQGMVLMMILSVVVYLIIKKQNR